MRSLLGAAAISVILAAAAVAAQERDARITALLDQAIAEQRVTLSCSTIEADTHSGALAIWRNVVEESLALLEQGAVPAETRRAFAAAARPEVLILPDDTPFAEVRAFCDAHPEWMTDMGRFEAYSLLPTLREELAR